MRYLDVRFFATHPRYNGVGARRRITRRSRHPPAPARLVGDGLVERQVINKDKPQSKGAMEDTAHIEPQSVRPRLGGRVRLFFPRMGGRFVGPYKRASRPRFNKSDPVIAPDSTALFSATGGPPRAARASRSGRGFPGDWS